MWEWQQKDDSISKDIARARLSGEDYIAEHARMIARGQQGSTNDVQRDKLIIETDLKLLAKWNPKRYGDRHAVEHSGSLTLESLVMGSMKAPD